MTDEQLKDMLIEVDDVNRIPLPSAAPCFIKEGLNFCYTSFPDSGSCSTHSRVIFVTIYLVV